MASSDFAALSTAQQKAYNAARLVSLHQNRYWEPSQDEMTGFLAGLSFVSAVVSDATIKREAASQAAMVGGWLSPNGYLFVRPNGGFAAQGGTDVGPALEYPFSRIFSRLTSSGFAATGGFVNALKNAGLWQDFAAAFTAAPFIGAGAAALAAAAAALALGLLGLTFPAGTSLVAILAAIAGPLIGTVLATLITAIGVINIVKAVVIFLNAESFDVWAWPGNNSGISASHGEQSAPLSAFLFGLFPSLFRFTSWMLGLAAGIGKYSENFPPFLGLSAFGDTNPTVGLSYRAWFTLRGGNSAAPASFPPPGVSNDAVKDYLTNADPFATAVAVLLGAGKSTQTKLVSLLTDLANEFSSSYQDQIALFSDNESPGAGPSSSLPYFSGLVGTSVTTPQLVAEPIRPTLNYLAAVALAWFVSSKVAGKSTLPPNFPSPPRVGSNLPPATIPGGVVENSFGPSVTYPQIIPLDALPPLPTTLPPEIDLFAAGAPGKPARPPAPSTRTTWILSTKKSHSGNLFGAKSTETLNTGAMLSSPGCVILGVKLFLIDRHGVPLGGVPTSVALGRASQLAGVDPWPSPQATTGVWPFQAGARILSIGPFNNQADMSVKVQWWYAAGTACRYQIAYLVRGENCSL